MARSVLLKSQRLHLCLEWKIWECYQFVGNTTTGIILSGSKLSVENSVHYLSLFPGDSIYPLKGWLMGLVPHVQLPSEKKYNAAHKKFKSTFHFF